MIAEISILMPTYNEVCIETVLRMARQARNIDGLSWEIIVADDGSTDKDSITANDDINRHDHCRFIRRDENVGRARIRNYLASEAKYKWLLFVDSGMGIIRDDFIVKYLKAADDGAQVAYGGYEVVGDAREFRDNLRYKYEKSAEKTHSLQWRKAHTYGNFHTSNFMISKAVYMDNPLDERFNRYGYEDVLLGKQLEKKQIYIEHIDNPVAFDRFENNELFMKKTEDSLLTLHEFADELKGYAKMLDAEAWFRKWHLSRPYVYIYNRCRKLLRANLCGKFPFLFLFKAYKLGFFLSLQE